LLVHEVDGVVGVGESEGGEEMKKKYVAIGNLLWQ